jgi:hypothetical protein
MRKWIFASLFVCGVAHADPEWRISALAGTDFPLDVGGGALVEGPYRLRLSSTIGYLPGAYLDSINAVVVAAGGYSQRTADLIRACLTSSLLFRTHAGWRPWARHGFAFSAGYGLVAFGGGVSPTEVVAAASQQAPPAGAPDLPTIYTVQSRLHMIDADVSWEWWLADDRVLLRAALGFSGTLASSTKVEPQGMPLQVGPTRAFADYAAAYLDNVYRSYFFTPTFTVNAAFRLY